MPAVVLRNKDLDNRPIVIDVAVGEYVPDSYKADWVIDTNTSPGDALQEIAEISAAAVEANAEDVADFVPEFAPDEPASEPPAQSGAAASVPAQTPAAAGDDHTHESE